MPLAVLAQRGPRRRFLFRAGPVPGENLGEHVAEHRTGLHAVLTLGGGVQESDALFDIHRDHRIADLREHFAAEAVLLGVETLEGEELRAGVALRHGRSHLAGADGAEHFLRLLQPCA